ncbi:hypothetical protein ENSA5_44360 [Enhygromyxa salina]|uniref:Uncharacterized protein n=1 Tax=Enhygromyxa salina TaxID=215803 RepID=A0A2S9XJV7_9BACT|nr:hypothetical protein [Enhygromyxa salina]PRP93169.1 hypothetical protein ENSA5_44360 [Enhygromyxa salina]
MTARRPLIIVAALLLAPALACEPDAAKDRAKDRAKEVGEQAKDKAGELAEDAVDKSKELWAERNGELSEGAKSIFAKGASASGEGVEALLSKGQQVAPVAVEIGKSLQSMIDSDVDIEPIVQKLDDDDAQAQLDLRIKDMPRVETIDGVDVGFKDVTQWDSGGRETESAYLILWRADERLLGLVYRSRKRINIDKMVEEAPHLLSLAQGVL